MIRAAVLGEDVSRSRSPQIHQAAYANLKIDGSYTAISVPAAKFRSQIRALIEQDYRYVNVTIPHKRLAAKLAHAKSPAVQMTGAANTLVFRKRRGGGVEIFADNTDGDGLLAAMDDLGLKLGRKSHVVMVGAGGAAAGALLALVKKGAHVTLLSRRRAPATTLRRKLPEKLRARVTVAALDAGTLTAKLPDADVLISAVPAVAWQDESLARAVRTLPKNAAVIEMAYGSLSPLARAVRQRTPRYQDGLPMLVHQAARAVRVALRRQPEAAPLFRAVKRAP